ncbi:hypothetical protein [Roseomonas haemaphysalidis]|uniref:hypothetical protein n=1 Tax=Roseomonas haemaphysalidis TaxID=2768162 RepID=UPI001A9759FA|nr:hypothetical protein [Roseomonas haemaphysalidis]
MDQRHDTPAAPDPAESFVSGGFEELGWQRLRLVPDPGAALPPVETRFAFAHPRHGVALVDLVPARAPEPVERLRRRLDADGEDAEQPGILHLVLTEEDVWRLSMVLDSALLAAPPAMPAEGWMDRVRRALLPAPAARPVPAAVAESRPAPLPVRSGAVLLPVPGSKAPASRVAAAAPRAAAGQWRAPLLTAFGLLAAGAAVLQWLGSPNAPAPAQSGTTPVAEAPPAAAPPPQAAARGAAPPPVAALPNAQADRLAALPPPRPRRRRPSPRPPATGRHQRRRCPRCRRIRWPRCPFHRRPHLRPPGPRHPPPRPRRRRPRCPMPAGWWPRRHSSARPRPPRRAPAGCALSPITAWAAVAPPPR